MAEDYGPYGYFDDPNEYFRRGGSGKSKFTKSAALAVCDMLTERGVFIQYTCAGYWHDSRYEERHEYGYTRLERYQPLSVAENNALAKREIAENSDDMNAFLIGELKE